MGNKPSVTLTLAANEKPVTEAFDRVGKSSTAMADKVDASSREMEKAGQGYDHLTEKSDKAESRFMGFHDTLDGTIAGFAALNDASLSTSDKLIALGQSGADLAGGFTNFVIPAMAQAGEFMKGPLRAAMTLIAEHPLLFTLGLIALAVIFLISQTDWFQKIATRVFNWVGDLVKSVFLTSINWVVDRWNWLIDFFESLPAKFGKALSALGHFIGDAFKAGINVAIDVVNWGIDRINGLIYGVNVISPFDDIPSIPHIPRLHSGGIFHSGRGEGLALLRDGERVTTSDQGGGSGYQITVALVEQIQAWFNDGTLVLVGR